jgi:hypothetical protein
MVSESMAEGLMAIPIPASLPPAGREAYCDVLQERLAQPMQMAVDT